ncbi:MAG: phospho-sugar mutase [Myxococcaceae bacterium]|nr:phospho-sugar mutase [Myxococcaceae bacterium]
MNAAELSKAAANWADQDPDAATAAEVRALIQKNDTKELEDRFGASLEFGTAGLRGVLGGGPNRMNRAVVRRTTAGLARYLKQHVPDVVQRGVVVGRDGRRMSAELAHDTAAVLAAEGIPALFFPEVGPTPLIAFATLHLKAAAAAMVTASHNPPEYNGFKVYWGNGAQIIPPHDKGIAAAIDAVEPANQVKLMPEAEARAKGLWRNVPQAVEREYLDAISKLRVYGKPGDLTIVYSAMHGVGGRFIEAALREAGFLKVHVVPEQQQPDGAFPTVRFPNPEEKGAMDLSTALAEKVKADLVLANDPDADRLAVMARDATGRLKMFTGNEVGVLLGAYLLEHTKVKKPLVITTIVSSAQLKAIAAAKGARYEECLTGFKWIANRALELLPEGDEFIFGFEEALGYTVGTVARDKDGVGTAVVIADLAAWCRSRGLTLFGYLEEVQRAHGLFLAKQANFTFPGTSGAATIRGIMAGFRGAHPSRIGELGVTATRDYQAGVGSLPKADVVAYELDGGSRVTLRPSGTEPKIKIYFELKEAVAAGEDLAAARARGEKKLAALEAACLDLAYARGLPKGGA